MYSTIHISGALQNLVGGSAEIQVESGRSVRETLATLGIVPEVVALVNVNGKQQMKDYVIQEGDVIRIYAIIGGG